MNQIVLFSMAALMTGPLLIGWAVGETTEVFGSKQNPVIKNFGGIYPVSGAAFQPEKDKGNQVIFDVTKTPKQNDKPLPGLRHAATYVNAYAMAGIAPQNINIICIVHGPAASGIMDDSLYEQKFNVKNPNTELVRELTRAGVKVYVCAQSLHENGFNTENVLEDVSVALSAMIVLTQAQDQGFAVLEY